MEIDQKLMLGCLLGNTLVVVDHPLVATIHKIDLDTRYAPLGKGLEESEVVLDGEPYEPQDDTYALALAVLDKLGNIGLGVEVEWVACGA